MQCYIIRTLSNEISISKTTPHNVGLDIHTVPTMSPPPKANLFT